MSVTPLLPGGEAVGEFRAARLSSWTPSASAEASHTIGGPMMAGCSRPSRTSVDASSGTIPVLVAPPGSRMLTVIGASARSAAITRDSASTAAPAGP